MAGGMLQIGHVVDTGVLLLAAAVVTPSTMEITVAT